MQFLWNIYELLGHSIFLVLIVPITLPCLAGAVPGFLERRRRRQLEEALPEVLESISSSIGAGLGLQQALTEISRNRQDETGKLLSQASAGNLNVDLGKCSQRLYCLYSMIWG